MVLSKNSVGKTFKCRGVSGFVEIVKYDDDTTIYNIIGVLHQENKWPIRVHYTLNGEYIENEISDYDLVQEISDICNHKWERELLFNIFHYYCCLCGIKK